MVSVLHDIRWRSSSSETTERQRADAEHQRAERLAAKLRELGVELD